MVGTALADSRLAGSPAGARLGSSLAAWLLASRPWLPARRARLAKLTRRPGDPASARPAASAGCIRIGHRSQPASLRPPVAAARPDGSAALRPAESFK
jgi:hypothetical protein